MAHLDGRVALVSGASGGIGRAVADRLAADGASVVRSDVRVPVDGIVCDVRDEASCAQAVAQVLASYGQLDILINVAGIGMASLVGDLQPSVWREIIEVNLTGTFLLSQKALPVFSGHRDPSSTWPRWPGCERRRTTRPTAPQKEA